MKFKQYLKEEKLQEMGSEIDLESGHVLTKKTIKKMKRKYKNIDLFITHLKSKIKNLSTRDEQRIRAAYKEV
jgi:hypothetical protein